MKPSQPSFAGGNKKPWLMLAYLGRGGGKFLHEEQLPASSTKQDPKHTDGTVRHVEGTDIPLQKHRHFALAHAYLRGVRFRPVYVTLNVQNTLLLEPERSINVT